MNTRYTGEQIRKIIQIEADDVMSRKCNFHDIYTERGLYDCISDCEGCEFDELWQLEIYPSIIRHEDSKSLTFVHKKFMRCRRMMFDTIVAAIYRKANRIREVCVVHREELRMGNCQCRMADGLRIMCDYHREKRQRMGDDCKCIGCQDANAVPPNAVEAVVPPPNA